jgi:hypothetical protein
LSGCIVENQGTRHNRPVCVCACVRERERERENECNCACLCVIVSVVCVCDSICKVIALQSTSM